MHSPRILDRLLQLLHNLISLCLTATLNFKVPYFTHDNKTVLLTVRVEGGTAPKLIYFLTLCDKLYFSQLDHFLIHFIQRFPTQKSSILRYVQIFFMRLLGCFRMFNNQISLN